jgi:uncharacterized membrane protein
MNKDNIDFAQVLIIVHATLGGIALLCGMIAILSKKGRTIHKRAGKVFFYSMLSSALMSLLISVLPNHESSFLFVIGVFSSYFILIGYRAINFKKSNISLVFEKTITIVLLLNGVAMEILAFGVNKNINPILAIFGGVAIVFAINNFKLLKNTQKLKSQWLQIHLGNMMGGYIAATTAFVVVNNLIPGVYAWFVPGVLGGLFIYYSLRKLSKPKKT